MADGWAMLPQRHKPPALLPLAPRAAARTSLLLYTPHSLRARVAWEALRLVAPLGALALLPKVDPPNLPGVELVQALVPRGGAFAAAPSWRGNWTALVLDAAGRAVLLAKVALAEPARGALESERETIEQLAPLLGPQLAVPRLLESGPGILVFEALPWVPRARPWVLDPAVATAVGTLTAAGASHGDFAPWNVLRTAGGWYLIDWADAQPVRRPFFDPLHYLVQAHALLGRPSTRVILGGLEGRGWVGAALGAYAAAAGVAVGAARGALVAYLEERVSGADRRPPDRGTGARRRLLEALAAS